MSHSDVGICNSGLQRIGQPAILSFDDDTNLSNYCKLFYYVERDFMLRTYPWNFSTKRAVLQRSATNPVWGFAYAYPLPADFMRMIKTDADALDYKVEGGSIVTDEETVKIKYSAQITDATKFDAAFSEMLAVRMSAVLAYPLTESNTLMERQWALYEEYEIEAFSADGQEGTPDAIEDRSFINVRV